MHHDYLENQISAESRFLSKVYRPQISEPTFIPIVLTGGIGDAILSRAMLSRLKKEGYQMAIWSKHADALRVFYSEIPIQSGDIPAFTWHLELDSIARFKFSKRFSGFIIPEHKALFDQQQSFFRENPMFDHLVEIHPDKKYVLTHKCKEIGHNAETFPIVSLGFKDAEKTEPIERLSPGKYITIHDGFDLNNSHTVGDRATKQWKLSHWNELVSLLREGCPEYEIVQLGSSTSRAIDNVHKNLVNKTTIQEAFDIIKRSQLHIDTDSGLAHAATAVGVPCVVMFGPTPMEFYGHSQNVNLSSKKSCSGSCFFLTKNWMGECPVGHNQPLCMDDITPGMVFKEVVKAIKQEGPPRISAEAPLSFHGKTFNVNVKPRK